MRTCQNPPAARFRSLETHTCRTPARRCGRRRGAARSPGSPARFPLPGRTADRREAVSSPCIDVGRGIHHQRGLLNAERVAASVVRAKHENAVRRAVPVVLVITLERPAEFDVPPGVLIRLSSRRGWSAPLWLCRRLQAAGMLRSDRGSSRRHEYQGPRRACRRDAQPTS